MNDYYKTWYGKNRDKKLAQNKAWKEANPERVRAYDREYKRRVRDEAKKAPAGEKTSPGQSDTEIKTA